MSNLHLAILLVLCAVIGAWTLTPVDIALATTHSGTPTAYNWPPWDQDMGLGTDGTAASDEFAYSLSQSCLSYGVGFCWTSSYYADRTASATSVSSEKFELQCTPATGWSHSWTANGLIKGKGEAKAAAGLVNGTASYDQFTILEYSADLNAVGYLLLAVNDSGSGTISVSYGPQGFTAGVSLSQSYSKKEDTDKDMRTPTNAGNGDKVAVDVYAKTDVNVSAECAPIIPGGGCAAGEGVLVGYVDLRLTCQGPTGSPTTYRLLQFVQERVRTTDGDITRSVPTTPKERTKEPGAPPGRTN